ncbi:MAG: DegQ family serine endoprotease [Acidobacteria bacterium]|nr:DegQ family serine endoprotease [Acidobacteriota bacterium]
MDLNRSRFSIVLVLIVLFSGACRDRSSGTQEAPQRVLPSPPARTTSIESYADVVEKVAAAVVTVRSERLVRPARPFPFFNDPFFDFFGFGGRERAPRLERGLGSGVIITEDGYIVTNHHVIDGADEIKVELGESQTEDAKIIGSDPPTDLAVLKISSKNLTALPLGDSDQVRVGDVVLAIGNPLNVGQTVTAGIISAKERATGLGEGTFESFLQTDAPINRGNSGGALVNTAGELIGINSQILSTTGGSIGIGFAIPSNMARQVSEQLIAKGKVRRSRLGVTIQPLTREMAESLDLDVTSGAIVSSVEPGSAADRAGLRQGDVITELNGQKIVDTNQFRNRVAATEPGTEVTLTIFRDRQRQQVRVRLQELSDSAQAESRRRSGGNEEDGEFYGMRVAALTPEIARELGLSRNTRGLVVTDVEPAGSAARSGIQRGDVITKVNQQDVRSVDDFRKLVEDSGRRPVLLLVQREGMSHFVTVQ